MTSKKPRVYGEIGFHLHENHPLPEGVAAEALEIFRKRWHGVVINTRDSGNTGSTRLALAANG